jgi:hypothetical protein
MWRQHYKLLIHPQFYMKLADRIYELPTQEVLRRHTVDDIKPHRTVSEHLFDNFDRSKMTLPPRQRRSGTPY